MQETIRVFHRMHDKLVSKLLFVILVSFYYPEIFMRLYSVIFFL